jgi:hypothetical protein
MITSHLRRRNPSIITLSNIKEIGNQVNHASILKQILVESLQITTYLPCASTFSEILEPWCDQLASVYRFAHLRSLFICTLLVSIIFIGSGTSFVGTTFKLSRSSGPLDCRNFNISLLGLVFVIQWEY